MPIDDENDNLTARIHRLRDRIRTADLNLAPPLPEAAVAEFERRAGVRLPEDYRAFLTKIGSSAPAPGAGLDFFVNDKALDRLSRPFPLDAVWTWDDDPNADEDLVERCQDGWLFLADEGCGMNWVLVVSGSQRGQVWEVEDGGAQPCAPPLSFLSWYELWLDWLQSGEPPLSWWDRVWADCVEQGTATGSF